LSSRPPLFAWEVALGSAPEIHAHTSQIKRGGDHGTHQAHRPAEDGSSGGPVEFSGHWILKTAGEADERDLWLRLPMLVKADTEAWGRSPTVVAWDAGQLPDAARFTPTTRPDASPAPILLREQWPAFDPLVEAFGYRTRAFAGYEADDVIATLAERGAQPGDPGDDRTGDRDAFQLVDEAGLVRVMADRREGSRRRKLYRPRAVLERYGHRPRADPGFLRAQRHTSDNIPRHPGIGRRLPPSLLQRFGSLEGGSRSCRMEVSGEKRRANLTAHPARRAGSPKQLATMQRDLPSSPRRRRDTNAGQPDMTALRRRVPALRAARSAASPGGSDGTAGGTPIATEPSPLPHRKSHDTQLAAVGQGELASRCRPPEVPKARSLARPRTWTFGVATDDEVLTGEFRSPAKLVIACATHAITIMTPSPLGTCAAAARPRQPMLRRLSAGPRASRYPLAELCEDVAIALAPSSAGDALAVRALTDLQRPD